MGEQHTDKCCYWDDEEFCDCGHRERRRLTTANADLQQRMDAAEEALRVAQGEVERLKPHNELLHRRVRTVEAEYSALAGNAIAAGNTRNGLGIEIVQLKGQLTAANSRVERLRGAMEELTARAIVLSDDYLESFKYYADDRTVQGWGVGRWRMLALALDKAQRALADDAEEGV